MISSSGKHYNSIDQIRALAAFLVFTWHFIHTEKGYPIPFESTPDLFFLSIIEEGHTGVALFMTLSGYLFSKIIDDKKIKYLPFIWNRIIRLCPLLFFIITIIGIEKIIDGTPPLEYLFQVISGLFMPSLPNGGWSVTVELHFYIILPLLIAISIKEKKYLVFILIFAITLRLLIFIKTNSIQWLSYWTILGRIDQFLLGILSWHLRNKLINQHLRVVLIITAFMIAYWLFNKSGGFYSPPNSNSSELKWIILPTIEGIAYGSFISWYDNSFHKMESQALLIASKFGEYSYPIYLSHFFFVFEMANFIHKNIMDISNLYIAMIWSLLSFTLMIIPGYALHKIIERPALKYRKIYLIT